MLRCLSFGIEHFVDTHLCNLRGSICESVVSLSFIFYPSAGAQPNNSKSKKSNCTLFTKLSRVGTCKRSTCVPWAPRVLGGGPSREETGSTPRSSYPCRRCTAASQACRRTPSTLPANWFASVHTSDTARFTGEIFTRRTDRSRSRSSTIDPNLPL